ADADALAVAADHERGDALVLERRVDGRKPGEGPRVAGVGDPALLPVEDPAAAFLLGQARLHPGDVGAGVGLRAGVADEPELLGQRPQPALLLLLAAGDHER